MDQRGGRKKKGGRKERRKRVYDMGDENGSPEMPETGIGGSQATRKQDGDVNNTDVDVANKKRMNAGDAGKLSNPVVSQGVDSDSQVLDNQSGEPSDVSLACSSRIVLDKDDINYDILSQPPVSLRKSNSTKSDRKRPLSGHDEGVSPESKRTDIVKERDGKPRKESSMEKDVEEEERVSDNTRARSKVKVRHVRRGSLPNDFVVIDRNREKALSVTEGARKGEDGAVKGRHSGGGDDNSDNRGFLARFSDKVLDTVFGGSPPTLVKQSPCCHIIGRRS